MRRRIRMPWTSSALIALSVFGLASFGVGSAAPIDQTVNLGNHVSTMTVQPPTNANAALSFQLLPLPSSCTAQITWTASPSDSVDAYEIRRVIAATGVVTGGSWSVNGDVLSYTDSKVPLALPVNTAEWQVRALVGAWPSEWAVASVDNPVLCLLGEQANAAPAPVELRLDDVTPGEARDDESVDGEASDPAPLVGE